MPPLGRCVIVVVLPLAAFAALPISKGLLEPDFELYYTLAPLLPWNIITLWQLLVAWEAADNLMMRIWQVTSHIPHSSAVPYVHSQALVSIAPALWDCYGCSFMLLDARRYTKHAGSGTQRDLVIVRSGECKALLQSSPLSNVLFLDSCYVCGGSDHHFGGLGADPGEVSTPPVYADVSCQRLTDAPSQCQVACSQPHSCTERNNV